MTDQSNTPRKSYHVSVPSVDTNIFLRLGSEPEMRYTTSGDAVLSLRGCASRRYSVKNGDETEWKEITSWYRVSIWRDQAERLANKHLAKGDIVQVTFNPADLKAAPFTNRDGQAAASLEIGFAQVRVIASNGDGTATAEGASASEEAEEIPF